MVRVVIFLASQRTSKLGVAAEVLDFGHAHFKVAVEYGIPERFVREKSQIFIVTHELEGSSAIEQVGMASPRHPGMMKVLTALMHPRSPQ